MKILLLKRGRNFLISGSNFLNENVASFILVDDDELPTPLQTTPPVKKREKRIDYTDMEILPMLNQFIFIVFVLYIFLLNVVLLIIFPYLLQSPLNINSIV